MKVHLLNARISFADGLFNASAMEATQKPKYRADFIIENGKTKVFMVGPDGKKTESTMEKVLIAVADEAWKGKGAAVVKTLESSKRCLRNGNTRVNKAGEIYGGYEGNLYVTAKNARRPNVFDRDLSPLTEESGKPYSGCYVNAVIDVYAMTDPKKKGVHASLNGVQFSQDGDRLGGGGSVATQDDFEPIATDETDDFLAD